MFFFFFFSVAFYLFTNLPVHPVWRRFLLPIFLFFSLIDLSTQKFSIFLFFCFFVISVAVAVTVVAVAAVVVCYLLLYKSLYILNFDNRVISLKMLKNYIRIIACVSIFLHRYICSQALSVVASALTGNNIAGLSWDVDLDTNSISSSYPPGQKLRSLGR